MTIEFLDGISAMCCAVIALFFYGYWRRTRDRLFGMFALAFVVFGVNRVLLSVLDENADERVYVYLVRLAAFALILFAVVDKNRAAT
jgi:glucose uptake protein GlcU